MESRVKSKKIFCRKQFCLFDIILNNKNTKCYNDFAIIVISKDVD